MKIKGKSPFFGVTYLSAFVPRFAAKPFVSAIVSSNQGVRLLFFAKAKITFMRRLSNDTATVSKNTFNIVDIWRTLAKRSP
jgi:hypothetical protein